MDGDCHDLHGEDLAEFGKNVTQIMILLPRYMWAENNNVWQKFPKKQEFLIFENVL